MAGRVSKIEKECQKSPKRAVSSSHLLDVLRGAAVTFAFALQVTRQRLMKRSLCWHRVVVVDVHARRTVDAVGKGQNAVVSLKKSLHFIRCQKVAQFHGKG